MPTNKQLEEKISILEACNNAKKLTIEKLKKENEELKDNEQGRLLYHRYEKLELKEHYQSDLYEWKEKHQSLQDTLDLYIEASNDDELKEDLEDYKLFCDAFDVDCAREAIHNHWRNLPDECKEELTKKGLNPK